MPKKPKKEKVIGRYFVWLVGQRDGVWYADGRSNEPSVGRHSLGTKDYDEAIAALQRLDLDRAVRVGRAKASDLDTQAPMPLSLDEGWELYRKHVSRPRVTGGAKPKSVTRYKAVLEKFIVYARGEGVTTWNEVTTELLQAYAGWMEVEGYAYRTEYLELTTLKQAVNWLKETGHLPSTITVELSLNKPEGTDAYCWTPNEVKGIVAHCRKTEGLDWLANVLTTLASTGLRISELAALRWSDVDLTGNVIKLTDESMRAPRRSKRIRRQTKNSRSRSFPISVELRAVLDLVKPSSDGVIFHGPRGGVLKPDTVRNILIREVLTPLSEKFPSPPGDVGFKDGRLHSFRHYFCSTCANSGVPEAVVMKWLGHRDSQMVRHYYHLHDAEAQRQMRGLTFIGNSDDKGSGK